MSSVGIKRDRSDIEKNGDESDEETNSEQHGQPTIHLDPHQALLQQQQQQVLQQQQQLLLQQQQQQQQFASPHLLSADSSDSSQPYQHLQNLYSQLFFQQMLHNQQLQGFISQGNTVEANRIVNEINNLTPMLQTIHLQLQNFAMPTSGAVALNPYANSALMAEYVAQHAGDDDDDPDGKKKRPYKKRKTILPKIIRQNTQHPRTRVVVFGSNKANKFGFTKEQQINNMRKKGGVVAVPTLLDERAFPFLLNVKKMATGDNHSVFLTNDGAVYVVGRNTLGECGMDQTKYVRNFKQLIIPDWESDFVTDIWASGAHNFFVTESGRLYFCGTSSYIKAEVDGHSALPIHLQNFFSEEVRIVQITNGAFHILFLTEDSRIFGVGTQNDKSGELGLGTEAIKVEKPVDIQFQKYCPDAVIKIASGENHNLVLTEKGEVYVFGENVYGQIGIGDKSAQEVPKKLDAFDGQKIIDISAGLRHSAFLSSNGRVWVCGSQHYGATGMIVDDERPGICYPSEIVIPLELPIFESIHIKAVACEAERTIFITEGNEIYTCGKNKFGELGYETDTPQQIEYEPKKVVSFEASEKWDIIQITGASNHTMMLLRFRSSVHEDRMRMSYLLHSGIFTDVEFVFKEVE